MNQQPRMSTPMRQFWPLLQRRYPQLAAHHAAGDLLLPDEMLGFVRRLGAIDPRSDLAFEFGRAVHPFDSFGTVFFVGLSCRTREDLYRYLLRHFGVMTELFEPSFERGSDAGRLRFTPRRALPPVLMAFMAEYLAVAVLRIERLMTQDDGSLGENVWLPIERPAHLARYAELAPAHFRFGSSYPSLTFVKPLAMLDRELPLAAPRIVDRYEAELQALASDLEATATLGVRVRGLLRHVQGKPPSIDDVARTLGMSPRSLDRNLDREGLNFREMAREVLIERARAMLAEPGATITQVSQRLGFSDTANFTRSFRRATGTPPSGVRT